MHENEYNGVKLENWVDFKHKILFNCQALFGTPYYTPFTYYAPLTASFETGILDTHLECQFLRLLHCWNSHHKMGTN